MSTEQKVIKHKVGLLRLAEELGNVSRACKVMGYSRDTFYRYKQAVEEGGFKALVEASRRKPNLRNRIASEIEEAVVALALVVQEPSVTLFAIGLAYAFSGPVEWVWRRAAHKPLEELPEPVPSEPSQG